MAYEIWRGSCWKIPGRRPGHTACDALIGVGWPQVHARLENNMPRRFINRVVIAAVFLCAASQSHAVLYDVNFNGATIDLSGVIDTNALGTFTPTAFDSQLTGYGITASNNGVGPFLFSLANSTWGGPGFGSNVSVTVSASQIVLSAPTGADDDSGNLFLIADAQTNFRRENLIIFEDELRYFGPNPPGALAVFDDIPTNFVLATARSVVQPPPGGVPEPGSLALLGIALGAFGLSRRRKAT